MAITAPVSLSENRVREILALSKREFDDREAKMKTTMVTTKFTPSDESVLKKGYRAIRSANGPDTYEITVPSDVASNMRRDWPYAVLSEGDGRQQIGCVTVDQNGCAITKFSRSESGHGRVVALRLVMMHYPSRICIVRQAVSQWRFLCGPFRTASQKRKMTCPIFKKSRD